MSVVVGLFNGELMQFKQNTLERVVTKITINKAKKMDEGQFEAVLSTDDLDRHGEKVSQSGITIPKDQTIKMYYNHLTSDVALPIGKWVKVWKSNGKLMGLGEIDLDDDFALKIYRKIQKGMIDSISIGFYPLEYDGETATWTKSNLVEASVVAEPANTHAVITSKQLGFTHEEFEESLQNKAKAENLVAVKRVVKGEVEDILMEPKKWELMKDFWEVIYAFEDAYYNQDTPASDFQKLLTETAKLLVQVADGKLDVTDKKASDASGASEDTEVKTAIEQLKSSVGALEAAAKASNENPAIKSLIKVRLAQKQVDKTNVSLGKVLRVKLKETN